MPIISTEVHVELDDFDDDCLIDEIESRGWNVSKEVSLDDDDDLTEIMWRYKNGYIEEAFTLLERKFPELHGISKYIK